MLKKNKKHLLLTLEYLPFKGGIARYLANLVENNNIYDFRVLKNSNNKELEEEFVNDVKVYKINFFYKYFWPKWLKIFFYLYKFRKRIFTFDCLHISHILPLGYIAYIYKKLFKIKYIIYLHGLDFNLSKRNLWKAFLSKKILKNADLIITNSKYLKEQVKNFLNDNQAKIEVIYPSFNKEILEYKARVQNEDILKLKEIYQIDEKDNIFLSVGRLVKRKGQYLTLQILKDIPNLKYFIIGNGPEKENIEKFIKENNLQNKVFLLTNISDKDLVKYYLLADFFILLTQKLNNDVEGFGIVFIEANAFGLPVIAGQGEGVKEAVINGETGIIISEMENFAKIKDEIENFINDQDLLSYIRAKSENYYQQFIYPNNYLYQKIHKYLENE